MSCWEKREGPPLQETVQVLGSTVTRAQADLHLERSLSLLEELWTSHLLGAHVEELCDFEIETGVLLASVEVRVIQAGSEDAV